MGARPEQWERLMDILSHDIELLHGDFKGPLGVVRTRQRWEEIAVALNQINGDQKDGAGWKEAWNGLKNRARDACRKKAAYMAGTGGGPVPELAGLGLSDLHIRVINLTGMKAALGSNCPNPLQMQVERAQNQQQEGAAAHAALEAPAAMPAREPEPMPALEPEAVLAHEPEAVPPPREPEAKQAPHEPEAVPAPLAGVIDIDGEDLMPFQWEKYEAEDEVQDEVIFLDLVSPSPKTAVDVKHNHVSKPKVKEEGFLGDLYHTPPRESGLTPSCKRRLLRDHTTDEGFLRQPDRPLTAESRFEAVIQHNTDVMRELVKVMQNINLKLGM